MPMGAADVRSDCAASTSCCRFLIFCAGSQLLFKVLSDDKADIIGFDVDFFRSCTRFGNKDRPLLFWDFYLFDFSILGCKVISCRNRNTKIRLNAGVEFPLLFQLFFTENGTGYI